MRTKRTSSSSVNRACLPAGLGACRTRPRFRFYLRRIAGQHHRIERMMSRSRAYRPSLRAVGLTWTVLLGAATAAVAQTRSDSPAPPVRLPGVVYPGDAAVTARDPKLKSKGQRAG